MRAGWQPISSWQNRHHTECVCKLTKQHRVSIQLTQTPTCASYSTRVHAYARVSVGGGEFKPISGRSKTDLSLQSCNQVYQGATNSNQHDPCLPETITVHWAFWSMLPLVPHRQPKQVCIRLQPWTSYCPSFVYTLLFIGFPTVDLSRTVDCIVLFCYRSRVWMCIPT